MYFTQLHVKCNFSFHYRAAKEQKKSTKASKKVAAPAAKAKAQPKTKAAKVSQKSAPRVGGKR